MIRIKCPCCDAELLIDERKKRLVGHTTKEDQEKSTDERFDDSFERVRRAKTEQAEKFDAAQEAERTRKERLASLFDEATKKVEEEGPVERPPERYWD